MKVLAEIGQGIQRVQSYFKEMDRQAKEKYYQEYQSPEAVTVFQFHRTGCAKTGPLEPVSETFMSVSGGGVACDSYTTYIRCVECNGSKRDKEK